MGQSGLARDTDGVAACRSQRLQGRFPRPTMLIPIASIFRKKARRDAVLVRRGEDNDSFWNTADLRLIIVFHCRRSTTCKGQCCYHDHRGPLKHVHFTLLAGEPHYLAIAARLKFPPVGFPAERKYCFTP